MQCVCMTMRNYRSEASSHGDATLELPLRVEYIVKCALVYVHDVKYVYTWFFIVVSGRWKLRRLECYFGGYPLFFCVVPFESKSKNNR